MSGASPVAQMVKNLPAMPETWVLSLGQSDPLENGMAPQSSVLAWRVLWTEEPCGLQSMGSQRVWHVWATNTVTWIRWGFHTSRKWGKRSYLKPPYCRCQDASFPPLESGTYYIFRTNRGRRGRLWFSIFQSVCYMESTLWTALGKRRFFVKQNTHLCNQTSCVTYVP